MANLSGLLLEPADIQGKISAHTSPITPEYKC